MTAVIDAEVMAIADAKRLDRRIRLMVGDINDKLDKLHELVDEAKTGSAWQALGFQSWTAYLIDVFPSDLKLERQQRRELVGFLSGENMSNRAVADAVGVDEGTVRNDLKSSTAENSAVGGKSVGKDGRARSKPKPKPKPKPAGERQKRKRDPEKVLRDVLRMLDAGEFAAMDKTTARALQLIIRAEVAGAEFPFEDIQPKWDKSKRALPEWDENAWEGEKINESKPLVKMSDVMWDTLDGVEDLGTEGEMLVRVVQSIIDFAADENKARGMARMMHAVMEFSSAFKSNRRKAAA